MFLNTQIVLAPITHYQSEPVIIQEIQAKTEPPPQEDIRSYVKKKALEHKEILSRFLVNENTLEKIINCESGWSSTKKGDNGKSVGLWQIHLPAHKDVTLKLAEDPFWSTDWAFKKIEQGEIKIWSCFWIVVFNIDPIKEQHLVQNVMRYNPIFRK